MRMHSGENKSRDQCILRDRFHFLFIQRNSLLGIQICVCHRRHPLRLMGIMLIRAIVKSCKHHHSSCHFYLLIECAIDQIYIEHSLLPLRLIAYTLHVPFAKCL